MTVERQLADPLANQILGPRDAAGPVDVNGAVPECPVGKDRDRHEGRGPVREGPQVIGPAQFGYVVGTPPDHRLEDLGHDPRRVEGGVDAVDPDPAVHQSLGAVVVRKCDVQLAIGHGSLPVRANVRMGRAFR